jgi:hypothetical protein
MSLSEVKLTDVFRSAEATAFFVEHIVLQYGEMKNAYISNHGMISTLSNVMGMNPVQKLAKAIATPRPRPMRGKRAGCGLLVCSYCPDTSSAWFSLILNRR